MPSHEHDRLPSEEDPLLHSHHKASTITRFRKNLTRNISQERCDLVLLLCYVITGLLDSSAVFIWGSFVSMQTGNTVYLGLGIVEPSASTRWIKSLISISFFCLGSLCFSHFHRYFLPRHRWVLCTSFTIQMIFVAIAAVLVTLKPAAKDDFNWRVAVTLALVAFQSSGQAVVSRALKFKSLTSVVLTSIYCDLFSDPMLLSGITQNAERNRRVAAPLLLLLGATLGGLFARSSIGLAGALWMAVGLKALIIIAWLLWASEEDDGED